MKINKIFHTNNVGCPYVARVKFSKTILVANCADENEHDEQNEVRRPSQELDLESYA